MANIMKSFCHLAYTPSLGACATHASICLPKQEDQLLRQSVLSSCTTRQSALVRLQADLAAAGEVGAAKKPFDLQLPQLGPYALDFTRSGNYMVLGGRKGHLALLQWQQAQQFAEVQVCLVGVRLCTMRGSG